MSALGGSRFAGRNCILIRLSALTSWGKSINLFQFTGEILKGHHHQVTKCQQWNKNNIRFYVRTRSSNLYQSCLNQSQGWLMNPKNAGICNVVGSFSRKPYTFCGQKTRGKEALWGTLSSYISKVQNSHAVQMVRPFHQSSALKAAPVPVFLMILKPAQKLLAIIVGRSIRKWWSALPPNKKELVKEAARRNKWKISLGLCSLGIVFTMFYFTHLEETPITGRSRLVVFGKEHLTELSQLEYNMWVEEFKDKMLPETDPYYQTAKDTVFHLAESNKDIPQISEVSWTVHVVEDPGMNAFALPNGQIFVFTGLLHALSDINQFSFILGHEMAHAILGHAAEKSSVDHFFDFLALILLTVIWAACPRDSLAILGQWIQSKFQQFLFDRPYSRALEAEADKVGLQLTAKACMDVRASSVVWQKMELIETIQGHPKIPEWLSTHPSHENRAEHLDRLIPEVCCWVFWQSSYALNINTTGRCSTGGVLLHGEVVMEKASFAGYLLIMQMCKALKIREHCNCPALRGPDPRLIFKKSMQYILKEAESKENPNVIEIMSLKR